MAIRHVRSRHLLTLLVLGATAAVAAQSAPAPPGPAELARRVQARYDTVRDFEGAFTQSYEGGVLRTKTTERALALTCVRCRLFAYQV